jgi:Concanavalin A-like lectin/glucanases superfamily
MANNFSTDASCKALFNFESGALPTDSQGSNTLTAGGSPTANTSLFRQGAASLSLNGSSYEYIADASLPTGFPWKSNDSVKQITLSFWIYFNSVGSYQCIWSKRPAGQGFWFGIGVSQIALFWPYNSGGSYEPWYSGFTPTTARWYHFTLGMDGVNKTANLIVYDAVSGLYTPYSNSFANALYLGDAGPMTIGAIVSGTNVNALFDEFAIFNRLLNPYEIYQITNGIYSGAVSPPVYPNQNKFNNDPSCKALWRFESGALLTDSIGTNTLVAAPNSPTADATVFVEGAASGKFAVASTQSLKIVDANLNAGFPFKNGDTVKKATICFWYQPTTNPANDKGLVSKWNSGLSFIINHVSNSLWINLAPGQYWSNIYTLNPGVLYHIAVELDGSGSTGTAKVRIYDSTIVTANNYTFTMSAGTVMVPAAGDLCIGQVGNNVQYINGNMDEVVVFNRLLSDAEIDAIRNGTFSTATTRNLSTACVVASAVSAPQAAITRSLSASLAVLSTVSGPLLKITRDLLSAVAVQSVVSTPLLAILRKLVASEAALSATGAPNLLVKRDFSTSVPALSAATTPNLLVQRALATLAATLSQAGYLITYGNGFTYGGGHTFGEAEGVTLTIQRDLAILATILSATSDVDLSFSQNILNLATVAAVQSQVSTPTLNILRQLNSTTLVHIQTSAPILAVLRKLVVMAGARTQTPEITLKVLRDLATVMPAQSAVSSPAMGLLLLLATAASVTTDTPSVDLAVLRDLINTLTVRTVTSDIALWEGVVPKEIIVQAIVSVLLAQISGPSIQAKIEVQELRAEVKIETKEMRVKLDHSLRAETD